MTEDNIYISLTAEEQRRYRSELLLAQTEVLNLMKKLASLEEIRAGKKEYRLKLAREFSVVLEGIKRFNEKMPNPKIPKNLVENVKETNTKILDEEEISSIDDSNFNEDSLERELREIQDQLKKMNG